ncbi:MAG: C40 family peptidase [Bacteroidota bacterium]|jgi:gamma-D-glutamyl-L-lysine dipeptidyl-peptidase
MNKGVINLSIVPLRSESGHTSEMVSQLLFGDTFEIIDSKDNWLAIKADYDGYCGWMQASQCLQLNDAEYEELINNNHSITTDAFATATNTHTNLKSIVPAGSSIALYDNNILKIGKEEYLFHGNHSEPFAGSKNLVKNAMMYLNAPYLWGGRSLLGIDCSGLTQMVYKLSGIKLLRDAHQQAELGTIVDFITEAHHGDLMFFDNENGDIVHVGIYIGLNKIIHASGKVRIDPVDHQGIFNTDLNHYSHVLRLIKRIV